MDVLVGILEYIYQIDCRFGRANVVVGMVFFEGGSALGARIFVKAGVYPSQANLSLDVPVVTEYPSIAVSYTGTDSPSLETVVGELGEIATEEVDAVFDVTEVVDTSEDVCSQEVTGEAFAEPIAAFGLYDPVFPFVAVDSPEVAFACDVKAPFGCQTDFYSDVGRQQTVG